MGRIIEKDEMRPYNLETKKKLKQKEVKKNCWNINLK